MAVELTDAKRKLIREAGTDIVKKAGLITSKKVTQDEIEAYEKEQEYGDYVIENAKPFQPKDKKGNPEGDVVAMVSCGFEKGYRKKQIGAATMRRIIEFIVSDGGKRATAACDIAEAEAEA